MMPVISVSENIPYFIKDGARYITNMISEMREMLFGNDMQKNMHYIRKFLCAYLSSNSSSCLRILKIEADSRGVSVEELRNLIMEKALQKMALDMELASIEYEYLSRLDENMTLAEYDALMASFNNRIREFRESYLATTGQLPMI